MTGYVWAVALVLIAGFAIALTFGGKSKPRPAPLAQPKGRETDMRVVVATSDERALRDVLAEFGVSYGSASFASEGVAVERAGDRLVLRFPHGLPPELFLFLVNFLHYPFTGSGFPGAYGVATVASALAGIGLPEALGRVVIFVPEDDQEQDAVWLRAPSDETWHYSFRAGQGPEAVPPRGLAYRDYWLPA